MLSVFLASFLATPDADACGNSMHHQLTQLPERRILVSYASDALEEDAVELAVLRRHSNQIRYCYERVLVKEPGLGSMTMTAAVSVRADGTVAAAEWGEEELHEEVSGCVQNRLVRMKLPEQEQDRELPLTITITHERLEG